MSNQASFFDFQQLFDADEYLYFMEDSLREEDTPAQVDFLLRRVDLGPGSRVLDLGCGHGRHSNELARRGHLVLGVDLTPSFLEVARKEAERDALSTQFVLGDMSVIHVEEPFDLAVCLFDAFGFFDDAHQLATLRCVHSALRDGGRFVLDLRTREWMVRVPSFSVLDKGNGDMMIDRHHFDIESGRFVDRRTYIRGGKARDVTFSVRLWAYTEIRLVLRSVGFEIESALGGYDGSPLSANKPRTLLLMKKVAAPTLEDETAGPSR